MVIKSMARKTVSFGQLLAYFNAPENAGPALLHNLRCREDDPDAIRAEFLSNAHRLPPRKNGNVLYHEILSFGEGDQLGLTAAMLEDLTRHYLELRAPYALAYAKAHFDTECPHVHILISANNVDSLRRMRLSKRRFQAIQREVELYQRERYPTLQHSQAQDRHQRGVHATRAEQERRRRGEKAPSRKEEIRDLIAGSLSVAASGTDCYRRLLESGLKLYRRGKSVGVEDLNGGRRYRLKTLGLAASFEHALQTWQQLPERLGTLDSRRASRSRDRGQARPL